MNPFLTNYITTLGSRQQAQISQVLQDAILGKAELNLIIQKLINFTDFVPLILNTEIENTIIDTSTFQQNIRQSGLRIADVFNYSNSNSLLLFNVARILISQISALEDQVAALEKLYNTYAFLASDGGAFTASFLESFNDNNGRESFSFAIPDRTAVPFADFEQAVVNSVDDTLVLAQSLAVNFPIKASIISGNATALVVSDTGIQHSTSSVSSSGWRVTFAAPQPITSGLAEGTTGAQVLVQFNLDQAAFASEIEVFPFSDTPMQILQARIFSSDDDGQFTDLISSPVTLQDPMTLHFQNQSVKRFRLLLNQPTYIRTSNAPNITETQYNLLNTNSSFSHLPGGRPPARKWNYQKFFRYYFNVSGEFPNGTMSRPTSYNSFRNSIYEVLRGTQTKLGRYESWDSVTHQENVITQLFLSQPGYYKRIFHRGISTYDQLASNPDGITPSVNDPSAVTAGVNTNPVQLDTGFSYKYDIGLQYVAIGNSPIGSRGVYVSKPIPAAGYVGAVRIKVDETNVVATNTDLDSPSLTVTEYSVSNQSNPSKESDWIPIIPASSDPTQIAVEAFFPDMAGHGFFRFPADRTKPIVLFKNGYKTSVNQSNYVMDPSNNLVLGLTLNRGQFTSQDIFGVSYVTSKDYSTINFGSVENPSLTSISDSTGAGEGFTSTGARNTITVSHTPFIDFNRVNKSKYSMTLGMNPYQPLTVILEDGSTAINLTNYGSGPQASLTDFSSGYYYIQSGNTLMFNRTVATPFRVFYQYFQNNIRVRAVLRVHSFNFASPTVRSINVKSKTLTGGVTAGGVTSLLSGTITAGPGQSIAQPISPTARDYDELDAVFAIYDDIDAAFATYNDII